VALVTVAIAWMLTRGGHYEYVPDYGNRFVAGEFAGKHPLLWPIIAAGIGIGVGALCGLLNGVLVASLRVGPFIVTLGTLLVFRGLAKGIAREQKIDAPLTWLTGLLESPGGTWQWTVLDPGVWGMLMLAILVGGLLRYTRPGRHIFAVGSNELTARLCGVPVGGVKIMVYVFGGVLTAIAGLMQFSRLTVGDPTVALGLELDVIAAVVIGGGSLAGGEGSILGTLIGALIMTTIRSGGSQMGWANWRQEIITGGIIVLAVALDRWRHRRDA
jgi:ribose transport system permease protein